MKTMKVEGYIVSTEDQEIYDYFGYPATSPGRMADQLKEAAGDEIEIVINSYGGDVWAAADMYAQLRKYEGETKASITGLAASAATILMCGCDSVEAWPAAEIMVHLSHSYQDGNYRDMLEAAESLKTSDAGLVAIYTAKTGQAPEVIQNLIEKTTWMTPNEALELGFIDTIVDPAERGSLPVAASQVGLPDIDKLRTAYNAAKGNEKWQAIANINIEAERFI